jgi:hypothetical protein
MKNLAQIFAICILSSTLLFSCNNSASNEENETNQSNTTSNETAEPTLLGKWRLVNFEMDGVQKFDDCDANTIWDFTETQVGNYQGKKLYLLSAAAEDPACRLFGFTAEWEEIEENATEVYIDNVKVGKGTNKGGVFKIDALTTKELKLSGGTWVYSFVR